MIRRVLAVVLTLAFLLPMVHISMPEDVGNFEQTGPIQAGSRNNYGNDWDWFRTADYRFMLNMGYNKTDLRYVGLTNNSVSIMGYVLSAGSGESLDNFLAKSKESIRATMNSTLLGKSFYDRNTTNIVCLDIEHPVNPRDLGDYRYNPTYPMDDIIIAFKNRIEVAREFFPYAKLSLYGIIIPDGRGWITSGWEDKMYGYQRMGELGAFDEIDLLCPVLYQRFGPNDTHGDKVGDMTRQAIEWSQNLTNSHGDTIPLSPVLGFKIYNGGSVDNGDWVRPEELRKQALICQQYPSVETILFWHGSLTQDVVNILEVTMPVPQLALEPQILKVYPEDRTNNHPRHLTLMINVSDLQAQAMDITWRSDHLGSWQQIGTNVSVPDGWYTQTIDLPANNTVYHWRVEITDGLNWNNQTFAYRTFHNNSWPPEGWAKDTTFAYEWNYFGYYDTSGLRQYPNETIDNMVSFLWLDNRTTGKFDPVRVAENTSLMPNGQKVLFSWWPHLAIHRNTTDFANETNPHTGEDENYTAIWWDNGTIETYNRFDQFFGDYKAAGGGLDHFVLDYENSFSNWANGQSFGLDWADRGDPWHEAKWNGVQNDSRFEEEGIMDTLLNMGYYPGRLNDTVYNWGQYANTTEAYDNYLVWNALMGERKANYTNHAVYDALKKHFPDATMSNYGNMKYNNSYNFPMSSGHEGYKYGNGSVVGTHQSKAIYGTLGAGIEKTDFVFQGGKYYQTPFNSLRYDQNMVRLMKISDPDTPVAPWIAKKSFSNSVTHKTTYLNESQYYQDNILHAGMAGSDYFLYWNSNATTQEDQLVSDTLGELDDLVGYDVPKQTLVDDLAPWTTEYLLTGMNVDGYKVWRITGDMPEHLWIEDNITLEGSDVAVTFDRTKVTFPDARVYRPDSPVSPLGAWIIQNRNASDPFENHADAPDIFNPIPANNSLDLPLFPTIGVNISDPNGDMLTIQYYSNMTGSWLLLGSNNSVPDGIYTLKTGFSEYNKTIWWQARVTDGKYWTNRTFKFQIGRDKTPPVVTDIFLNRTFPLSEGQLGVVIWFDKPMNTAIDPNVTIELENIWVNGTRFWTGTSSFPVTSNGWTTPQIWNGTLFVNTSISNGLHYLNISGAEDTWGNLMIPNRKETLFLDTLDPSSVLQAPTLINSRTFDIILNATDANEDPYRNSSSNVTGVELWYRAPGDTNFTLDDTYPNNSTVTFEAEQDGYHRFFAIALDEAGNRGSGQMNIHTTLIDTVRPTVTSVTFDRMGPYNSDFDVTVTFNEPVIMDNSMIIGYYNQYDIFRAQGDFTDNMTWEGTVPVNEFTITESYTLNVHNGTDLAGNKVVGDISNKFLIDIDLPEIKSLVVNETSPLDKGNYSATITINEVINITGPLDVNVWLDGKETTSQPYEPEIPGEWKDNNTWVGNFTITEDWEDGEYFFFITGAVDFANNGMLMNRSYSFKVNISEPVVKPNVTDDTPVINITSPAPLQEFQAGTQIIITGTSKNLAGKTIEASLPNGKNSTIVGEDGEWTLTLKAPKTPNQYVISVEDEDGKAKATVRIVVTDAPVVTDDDDEPGGLGVAGIIIIIVVVVLLIAAVVVALVFFKMKKKEVGTEDGVTEEGAPGQDWDELQGKYQVHESGPAGPAEVSDEDLDAVMHAGDEPEGADPALDDIAEGPPGSEVEEGPEEDDLEDDEPLIDDDGEFDDLADLEEIADSEWSLHDEIEEDFFDDL